MNCTCYNCGGNIELSGPVGRKDECNACKSDLHCCMNCVFYDSGVYNECKESQAERVLDKERGNFCDFFKFKLTSSATNEKDSSRKKTLTDLDDLFK